MVKNLYHKDEKAHILISSLFYTACKREDHKQDILPNVYGSVPGRCVAEWTCADWMRTGHCNTDWSEFPQCAPGVQGKIRDFCKDACDWNNKCGIVMICLWPK